MRRHRPWRRLACPDLTQRQNWRPLEAAARRIPLGERQSILQGRTGRPRRTAGEFCLVVSFAFPVILQKLSQHFDETVEQPAGAPHETYNA